MRRVLWIGLLLSAAPALSAGEKDLELLMEVRPGRGDKPMVVVWVEDGQGKFVETLEICSQDVRYYRELQHWHAAQNGHASQEIDALIGATIRWGGKRLIEIPAKAGRNLLDGNHVICIEAAADKGSRYGVLKIPLAKDLKSTTVDDDGYVSRAVVRLAGAGDEAPQPAAPSPPPDSVKTTPP